jgi:1-phosphatidylinositol phosphodiesterase
VLSSINRGELEQSEIDNRTLQNIARQLYPSLPLLVPSELTSAAYQAVSPERQYIEGETSTFWLRSWMWQYQQFLGDQKITELILPGTHDSGTYDMVSPFARPWTQCQNLDIRAQLYAGARVLDIRTGIQPDKDGDERYILVHDSWRSRVTMSSALEQVLGFCAENTGEIVILDFHRFVDFDGTTEYMYNQLVDLIKTKLGDKLIPATDKDKTLNELVKGPGRIIVAWNRTGEIPSGFWGGVNQQWWNKDNKSDLFDAMKAFYEGETPTGLWASCAIVTPDTSNISPIQSLNPDLSLWFTPDGTWAQKSNIVSCDFIETTQLCASLVHANLVKASTS